MKINISILSIILLLSSFLLAYQLSFAEELTIYDIQYTTEPGDGTYPSPMEGETVTVIGIVSAIGYYSSGNDKRFFITDPEGGPWHGIFIFNYDYNVELGDEVEVTGKVDEYYGYTEIKDLSSFTIVSSGNPVPEPIEVNTGDLINSADAEQYEGCLVKVSNVQVTQTPDNHNEWYVDDGSGECQIDDGMYDYQPTLGENIAHIIGVVDYSYSEYGVNPRMAEDILQIADIDIVISDIHYLPENPFFDEDIAISAEITTYGCSLVADTLFYKLASETIYQDTIMVDTLGTNEYSAIIPAFNIMENIIFYIKAVSDSGIVRETSLQTITIRDRSPIITDINTTIINDTITVSAKIEDTDGQVVKAYTLCWLDFSEDYFTYPMVRDTTDTTYYNGIIPPQSQGSTIYFKICAVDDSGLIAYADDNGKPYEYQYPVVDHKAILKVDHHTFAPSLGEKFTIKFPARSNEEDKVILRIYNSEGKLVHTIRHELSEGYNEVEWDGKDSNYNTLPLGLYICHLEVVDRDTGNVKTAVAPIVIAAPLKH